MRKAAFASKKHLPAEQNVQPVVNTQKKQKNASCFQKRDCS